MTFAPRSALFFGLFVGCGSPAATSVDASPGDPDAAPDSAIDLTDAGSLDASRDAAPIPSDPDLDACWPGHWCWLEGADIVALDGPGGDAVYAADRSGRIFHRQGTAWVELPGVHDRRALNIHVTRRDDVWALTQHRDEDGFFLDRFDGSEWTTIRDNVDPDFLAGYDDHIWVRSASDGDWLRFDGERWHGWYEDSLDVERYGSIATELVQKRFGPMLVPGPSPEAYAITEGVVPIVMRFTGERWVPIGAISTGWSRLTWNHAANEIRVIEYTGTGLGADSTELRHDGNRWTPTRQAPEGGYFIGGVRGTELGPPERNCAMYLPDGDGVLCASGRQVARYASAWSENRLPEPARPFSPALWNDVPAAYWAPDALDAWGEGPARYWRIREDDTLHLEHVLGDSVRPVRVDDLPARATRLRGTSTDSVWALSDRQLLHVEGDRGTPQKRGVRGVAPVSSREGWLVTEGTFDERPALTYLTPDEETHHHSFGETDFINAAELVDVVRDERDDLWIAATLGLREQRAVLFHRDARSGAIRSIDLATAWANPQIAAFRDAIYLVLRQSVFRIPIEELQGAELERELAEYELRFAPQGVRWEAPRDRAPMRLFVDETGVWLISSTAAIRYVEP